MAKINSRFALSSYHMGDEYQIRLQFSGLVANLQ
jgi:hypothetical protein